MKSLRFLPVSLFMAVLLFLVSCNGNEEKKSTDKITSDSSTATAATPAPPPTPASTIITSEQNMMLVKSKVANYAKWKMAYDAHDSVRLSYGCHSFLIGRGVQDSNTLLVAIKADDMAKAKEFAKSPNLKEAMKKSGVVGAPDMAFVTITYMDTSTNNANLRSIARFNVKDWAAFQKAFMEGKQERMDNGIMLRAYGHDADNNNRVTVVTVLSDSAKAVAYWKSDMMKKRRADAGVIGEPERFVYHVAARY